MTRRLSVSSLVPILLALAAPHADAQALDFTAVEAEVDFGQALREWDGFGFNYVETAQTRDCAEYPQEYGGWSDAVVEVNIGEEAQKVRLAVGGSKSTAFQAYRTTDDDTDRYADVGRHAVEGGALVCEAPAGSVTTFFGLP